MKEVTYSEAYTEYYPNGSLKTEGTELISRGWTRDYLLASPPVAMSRRIGRWISYYENGNKKHECNYAKCKDYQEPVYNLDHFKTEKVGNETWWFENGQIDSVLERDLGDKTYWYENGNKKSEGCFEGEDGCVGKWMYWHNNGQLACIGILQGFRGNGLWTFWDENGNKIHEREYRENELLDVWKNLRKDGCSEELKDKYKQYIFNTV